MGETTATTFTHMLSLGRVKTYAASPSYIRRGSSTTTITKVLNYASNKPNCRANSTKWCPLEAKEFDTCRYDLNFALFPSVWNFSCSEATIYGELLLGGRASEKLIQVFLPFVFFSFLAVLRGLFPPRSATTGASLASSAQKKKA